MKVKELQKEVSKLDPELDVLCYSEDTQLLSEKMGFRLFEIENVGTTQGERVRLDDGTPYLKLGEGPGTVTLVIIGITANM